MDHMILAHKVKRNGVLLEQSLEEHLIGTAKRAYELGQSIGLGYTAKMVGYVHDLGKYASLFQNKKLRDGKQFSFDHTLAGAQILVHLLRKQEIIGRRVELDTPYLHVVVNAIISHHIGLSDMDRNRTDNEYSRVFCETDPKYEVEGAQQWLEQQSFFSDLLTCFEPSYKELVDGRNSFLYRFLIAQEIGLRQMKPVLKCPAGYSMSCLTRMLSSILRQADFADTSYYVNQIKMDFIDRRVLFQSMLDELCQSTAISPQNTNIQKLRAHIFAECMAKGKQKTGCYRLPAPVGSGKTRASMAFALTHALYTGKDRIIYVSPYDTIVSQNYNSIREATGIQLGSRAMIERGALVQIPDSYWNTHTAEEVYQLQLSVSSLDAPVSFTTTVQFENALLDDSYSSYHIFASLSNAVIILDEIQVINTKKYHNLMLNINYLVAHMNTTVLICTATPPELEDNLKYRLLYSPNRDIINDPVGLRKKFSRVEVHDITRMPPFSPDTLCKYVLDTMQRRGLSNAIIIVNTKKSSEQIYAKLCQNPNFHVIRFNANGKLYADHIIKEIQEWLKRSVETGERFILVATSIIEVGVDVSFQCGFREITSLVSLEQSSGRVNRNGEYPNAPFFIFRLDTFDLQLDSNSTFFEMTLATRHTISILWESGISKNEQNSIPAYLYFSIGRYKKYYDRLEQELLTIPGYLNYIDRNTGKNIVDMLSKWEFSQAKDETRPSGEVLFKTAYHTFHSTETNTKNVLCENLASTPLIQAMLAGKSISPFHEIIIKNSIAIRPYKIKQLQKDGLIRTIGDMQILHHSCMDQYGAVLC